MILGACALGYGTLRSSAGLHRAFLAGVVRCPTRFFDTTPIGRVLNRFSRDVDVLDVTLPTVVESWLICAFAALGTVVVVGRATPIVLAPVGLLALLYYGIKVANAWI